MNIKTWGITLSMQQKHRRWSDCVDVHGDLRLHCSPMAEKGFLVMWLICMNRENSGKTAQNCRLAVNFYDHGLAQTREVKEIVQYKLWVWTVACYFNLVRVFIVFPFSQSGRNTLLLTEMINMPPSTVLQLHRTILAFFFTKKIPLH